MIKHLTVPMFFGKFISTWSRSENIYRCSLLSYYVIKNRTKTWMFENCLLCPLQMQQYSSIARNFSKKFKKLISILFDNTKLTLISKYSKRSEEQKLRRFWFRCSPVTYYFACTRIRMGLRLNDAAYATSKTTCT